MSNYFPETLPPKTAQLVKSLSESKPEFLEQFYLSGGTALSLQLCHRESEDLVFFNQHNFDPIALQSKLETIGNLQSVELATGTLNCFLDEVKLQFLEYPYKLLEATIEFNSLKLSSVIDIGCTKLQTVGARGSKKDFIDLHFIFGEYSLDQLLRSLAKKYDAVNYNLPHILKSLVYFDDAEQEPMPRMHKKVDWSEVKLSMVKAIKEVKF